MKFYLMFTVLLTASVSFASGSRVGSGGEGVVCEQSLSPKLLDLYEATEVYGRTAFINPWDQRTELEHVTAYTLKLRGVLGANHPLLRVLDETLLLRSTMQLLDGPLRITTDTGWFLGLKDGCTLLQIAARGEGLLNGKLDVLKSFWFASTEQEKALLLIHEALHTWFTGDDSDPDLDSDAVGTLALRQLVGLLYTDSATYPKTDARILEIIRTRKPLTDSQLSDSALRSN